MEGGMVGSGIDGVFDGDTINEYAYVQSVPLHLLVQSCHVITHFDEMLPYPR